MKHEHAISLSRQFAELGQIRERRKAREDAEDRDLDAEGRLRSSLGRLIVGDGARRLLTGPLAKLRLWELVRHRGRFEVHEIPVEHILFIPLPDDPDPEEYEAAPPITISLGGAHPTEAQAEGLEALGLGDAVDQITEWEADYVLRRAALMGGFAAAACVDIGPLEGPRLADLPDVEEVA